ncbi:MAG: T9SS type A sorting domain-containing protein [Bacteroidota bacterium]
MRNFTQTITLFVFILLAFSSKAAKITAKAGGGNWNAAGTWNLGRVPACGDTVVIPVGVTVHVAANVALNGGGCAPVTIQVAGKLTFANGRKIRLSAGGCMQLSLTGQVNPSGVGGGSSELIEIDGQDWWQASDGVLNGTATGVFLGCGVALPVELVDYSVEYQNDIAEISFATASERDLDYFVVEMSRDGSYWQELGTVDAAGNTTSETSYKISDKSPFNGVSYYRLREVDINGVSLTLDILVGNYSGVKYLLYPVPVNKSMFLEGSYLEESAIKVINSVGDQVDVSMTLFGDKLSFDFSAVKNGIYYLVIENQYTKRTERVSVVHK